VNEFYQSFSSQTKGFLPRVIASLGRGDPEKSLKFIIFIFCHLGFAGLLLLRIAMTFGSNPFLINKEGVINYPGQH